MFIVFEGSKGPHSFRSAMFVRQSKFVILNARYELASSSWLREHCTPKGVPEFLSPAIYKPRTPPEY